VWLRNRIIGQRKEVNMTDDKKKDDPDHKKVSDEEMEDVAGGGAFVKLGDIKGDGVKLGDIKGEAVKRKKPGNNIVGNPYPSP
jgi:hypothetical protein